MECITYPEETSAIHIIGVMVVYILEARCLASKEHHHLTYTYKAVLEATISIKFFILVIKMPFYMSAKDQVPTCFIMINQESSDNQVWSLIT